MSIRTLWIVSAKRNEILFSRYFGTVEAKARAVLADIYVPLPSENEFVQSLLTEIGLLKKDEFVESRNSCDKPIQLPVFQVPLASGTLWPVVVMEHGELIYCALPFVETNSQHTKQLADLPCVSTALDILQGLAQCVVSSGGNSIPFSTTCRNEILQFVATSLPFGQPICCDAFLMKNLLDPKEPPGRGKVKQPVWNPVPHKGKSQLTLHIKEEVRSSQHNQSNAPDIVEVYGTITCKAEVEGTVPEITLALGHTGSQPNNPVKPLDGLCFDRSVLSVESNKTNSGENTRIRFHPSLSQITLCHYTLPQPVQPPVYGALKLRVKGSTATLLLQLQLNRSVKNIFQQLEAHMPFHSLGIICDLKTSTSVGSVYVSSDRHMLVWNLGPKFSSKTLDASLNAIVKVKRKQALDEVTVDNFLDEQSVFAQLVFKIMDYTYSGCRVDPQSIMASTSAKIRYSMSSEFLSGQYRIWNSQGNVPSVAYPVQELKELLIAEENESLLV